MKINGVRVEPGEIEATLAGAPGITAAAVTLFADSHGRPPPDRVSGRLLGKASGDGKMCGRTGSATAKHHGTDLLRLAGCACQ